MRAELLAACEHFERDVIETVPLHHDPGVLLVLGTAHLQGLGLAPVPDFLDYVFRIALQARSLPSPLRVLNSSSLARQGRGRDNVLHDMGKWQNSPFGNYRGITAANSLDSPQRLPCNGEFGNESVVGSQEQNEGENARAGNR